LRHFFRTETTPIALLNFENSQIFSSAIVEANILITKKKKFPNQGFKVAAIQSDAKTKSINDYFEEKSTILKQLNDEGWLIADADTYRIKEEIEQGSVLLKTLDISINFGVKTGYNKAFIISGDTKKVLVQEDINSKKVLKPTLRGRDIQKYKANFSNLWLMFIPWNFPLQNDETIKAASPKATAAFKEQYPSIYNYLLGHEERLKGRNKAETGIRYQWYCLQRWGPNYYQNFEKPKIIWGELSDKPKFYYDEEGYYPEATLFFMTGESLKYILAVMNSRLGEWYFSKITTTSGMGTNRWKKYKIENFPIKPLSPTAQKPFEILVDYVLWLKSNETLLETAVDKIMASYFESMINGGVYELYFEESLKAAKKDVLQYIREIPALPCHLAPDEKLAHIRRIYAEYHKPDHPLGQRLYYIDSVPEIRIIHKSTINSI